MDRYVFRSMCYASCAFWCGVLAAATHEAWIPFVTFGVVLNPFFWWDFAGVEDH